MKNNKKSKDYLTTTQAAKKLGISRMQVIRKIRTGDIDAQRVGRSFIIPKDEIDIIFKSGKKKDFEKVSGAVRKVIREYGEVIKRLSKE